MVKRLSLRPVLYETSLTVITLRVFVGSCSIEHAHHGTVLETNARQRIRLDHGRMSRAV
jgi:hypothetical protein